MHTSAKDPAIHCRQLLLSVRKHLLLLPFLLLLFYFSNAQIPEFRGGNIAWTVDPSSPLTIHFKVTQSWRKSFDFTQYDATNPAPANVVPGSIINFGPRSGYTFHFGDQTDAPITLRVTSINNTEDWFTGVFEPVHTYPQTTYLHHKPFFEGNWKLPSLQNNGGHATFRVEANVLLNSHSSPISQMSLMIDMKAGSTFQMPVTDPQGNPLTFSIPPSDSYTATNTANINTEPPGFTVSESGLITFNTSGLYPGRLFNGIVRIADDLGSYTQLDFIIRLVPFGNPPAFNQGGTDRIFNITPGQTLDYTVKGGDQDVNDNLTMTMTGLMPGATLTPNLPYTGAAGDSVTTSFHWIPTLAQTGAFTNSYTITDNSGLQATENITVNVRCDQPGFDATFTFRDCINLADMTITVTTSQTSNQLFQFSKDGGVTYSDPHTSPYVFYNLTTNINYPITVKPATSFCYHTRMVYVYPNREFIPPVITCPADIHVTSSPHLCGAIVQFPNPTATDNCGVVTVRQIGGLPSGSFFPVSILPSVVTFTAEDPDNNFDICSFNIYVTDNENPVINCLTPAPRNTDPGKCYATIILPQPIVSDNCGVLSVTNDHASNIYPTGSTTVTWTVTDTHSHSASCNTNVVVNDNENPTINCVTPAPRNTDAGKCYATITLPQPTVNDNCGVLSVTNDHASNIYPTGSTTITWTVTDTHGNSASCTTNVVVNDNENPTINCVTPVPTNTDEGQCYATIILPQPTVNDNCAVLSVTNDHADNRYPTGLTPVTWTVTDTHGHSASCTTNVVVIDNENPTINCVTLAPRNTDAGQCFATITLPQPTVSDNCGILSVTNDHPSNMYPTGSTTVTWTVTDTHGHSATCTTSVVVIDRQPPVVICTPSVFHCYDDNVNGVYAVPMVTSTDNCSVSSITYVVSQDNVILRSSPTSGMNGNASGSFNVGVNTIVYTAKDAAGNIGQCTSTVTINPILTATIPAVYAFNPGANPNTIYLGFGPSSLLLRVVGIGGTPSSPGTYVYNWSSSTNLNLANTQTLSVSPSLPGTYTYTVSVTDSKQCKVSASITITVSDIRCDKKNDKVLVCEIDPKKPAQQKTHCISSKGVAEHLLHGWHLGACLIGPVPIDDDEPKEKAAMRTNISNDVKTGVVNPPLLMINVSPNPSNTNFTIQINSISDQKISLRLLDGASRVFSRIGNITRGKTITIGQGLKAGTYFAEIIQGENKKVIKLIKL